MTNAVNKLCTTFLAESLLHCLSLLTVPRADSYFDQLMSAEGDIQFIENAVGEAMLADHDYRL